MKAIADLRSLLAARRDPRAWEHARHNVRQWHDALAQGWMLTMAGPALVMPALPLVVGAARVYQYASWAWTFAWVVAAAAYLHERFTQEGRFVAIRRHAPAALVVGGFVIGALGAAAFLKDEPAVLLKLRSIGLDGVPEPEVMELWRRLTVAFGAAMTWMVTASALLPAPLRMRLPSTVLMAGLLTWVTVFVAGKHEKFAIGFAIAAAAMVAVSVVLELPFLVAGLRDYENGERARGQAKRRRERELELAAGIQTSLHPPPSWHSESGIQITSYQKTHKHIGGDWLAIRETADGRVIALVLDVTGKGVPAALVAHAAQSVWALSLGQRVFDPEAFLQNLNTTLFRLSAEKHHTATAGILEIAGPVVTYWSAAHTPVHAVWRDATGESCRRLRARGDMLGMRPTVKMSPAVFEVPPGAEVHLLHGSDGVWDGLPLSPQGGQQLLRRLEAEGPACIESIPVEDDKTLMWIRYTRRADGGGA